MLTVLAIYISFILLLVFVLLFGPSPRFRYAFFQFLLDPWPPANDCHREDIYLTKNYTNVHYGMTNRNGIIGKLHVFITDTIWTYLGYVLVQELWSLRV